MSSSNGNNNDEEEEAPYRFPNPDGNNMGNSNNSGNNHSASSSEDEEFLMPLEMGPPMIPPISRRPNPFSFQLKARKHETENEELKYGGKVSLPENVLKVISSRPAQLSQGPMIFKVQNKQVDKVTYCGVHEFTAPDGTVLLPEWVMNQTGLNNEDPVNVELTRMPQAKYTKFRPDWAEFQELPDHKTILEIRLRNFACLTIGDSIPIEFNGRVIHLEVVELEPASPATIIECDLSTEFDFGPIGAEEPEKKEVTEAAETEVPAVQSGNTETGTFVGPGQKLKDGEEVAGDPPTGDQLALGIPDFDWRIGSLNFLRPGDHNDEGQPK